MNRSRSSGRGSRLYAARNRVSSFSVSLRNGASTTARSVMLSSSVVAWVTIVPTLWLLVCTLTAGWQKIFSADVKIGFLAHATKYADALAQGKLLAPAKAPEAMARIVFNDRLDAALCVLFMGVVISVLVYSVRTALAARAASRPTVHEVPFATLPEGAR